jgi:hypothetical protein
MKLINLFPSNAVWMLALILFAFPQEQQRSKASDLQVLLAELYTHPWPGAENGCSPMCWNYQFTPPMLKILKLGPPAQGTLLEKLNDPATKDQVIILLGGLGDEQAVGPIIKAMVAKEHRAVTPNAERINLAANLALTNITVADVIWHHGGGIEVRRCAENSKECWVKWWEKNKATFTVKGIKQSRRYSNYPNYGIYKQQ